MLVLAGIAGGTGLWWYSETFRDKVRQTGTVLAWYGVRAYTELEVRTERVVSAARKWAGWADEEPSMEATESELVPLRGADVQLCIRRTLVPGGGRQVAVGRSEAELEARREPCRASIYAPVIRLRTGDGSVHSYPVDFDGEDYCLVGNVLFDPAFVGYWLSTRHSRTVGIGETWDTSFIGQGMVPMTVSHQQQLVCGEEGLRIEDLNREEPSGSARDTSPASEPWLLDLGSKTTP